MPRLHGAVGLAKSERPPCTGHPQPRPGPLSDPLSLPDAQDPLQGEVGHRPPRSAPSYHPGDPNLRTYWLRLMGGAPAHIWLARGRTHRDSTCSHMTGHMPA